MKYVWILALVAALILGVEKGWIPIGPTMNKMGQRYELDMKNAVKKGMKEDEVIRAIGPPDQRIADPMTGASTWTYKRGEETLLVSFNMDEVADVRTTRL